jgi:hypothetical protein
MATIRWLHLTDLHVGMGGMRPWWPSVKSVLFRDLEDIHRLAGPFDLVLFSGDLVQSGTKAEFEVLSRELDGLWQHLRGLGSTPTLLVVPGNHDLVRPKADEPAVRALLNWSHDQDLRRELFWDEARGKEYRAVLKKAFAGYVAWRSSWDAAHAAPAWIERSDDALLPGEFSASIIKEGLSLGIVGLNTTYLQLSGKIGRAQLALHPDQLHRVCGGDPGAWTARHHVNLLMTHHPPDWLSPDALAYYQGAIFPWFSAHFCGHLHEPLLAEKSFGGSPAHRVFQGASLFGLERWEAEGRSEARLHGYSAARIELEPSGRIMLRIWPRIARHHAATGRWSIVPDYDNFFSLDAAEGNSLLVDLDVRTPSRATAMKAPRVPQPPGVGYDPAWYVPRDIEDRALSVLRQPGAPVVLTGAPMIGTSTVLQSLIHQLREERLPGGNVVIEVDCAGIDDAMLDSPEACLLSLGEMIARARVSELDDVAAAAMMASLDDVWKAARTPERKLTAFVERTILASQPQRVVLVLDRFDRVIGRGAASTVAGTFRRWMDRRGTRAWSALRLLFATEGASLHFSMADDVSEFFNVVQRVRVEGFDLSELRRLAELYGRPWSDDELERIVGLVDGQPYLSRLILFLEATGTPKAELLDLDRLKDDHCAVQLRQLWLRLKDRPNILEPVSILLGDSGRTLSADEAERLRHAGLARRKDGAYTVPNKLLAAYLRERC